MMICLFIFGVLMIGTVSQGLSENNKAEGITSGASMSDQSERPFFSKDNLILLAQNDPIICTDYKTQGTCEAHYPTCAWYTSNSSSHGLCYWKFY